MVRSPPEPEPSPQGDAGSGIDARVRKLEVFDKLHTRNMSNRQRIRCLFRGDGFLFAESVALLDFDYYMTFREPLPDGCPPPDAQEITQALVVFRLVDGDPPTDDDFRSQRAQKPNNQFNVPECQARGLSVFSKLRDAEKQLRMPNHNGKLICRATLDRGAGHILKTGRKSHFTWWPLADFDTLNHCQMVI